MKKLMPFLWCLIIAVHYGYGQNNTHTDQVSITINQHTELRFKPDHTSKLLYEFTSADDYQNGVRKNNAAILQVSANTDWVVNVKSGSENFSYSGSEVPAPEMPSTVLKVRNRPARRINLTTTDTQIANGGFGGWEENEFDLRYIALPRFNYPAGTYTIDLIYTVSAE